MNFHVMQIRLPVSSDEERDKHGALALMSKLDDRLIPKRLSTSYDVDSIIVTLFLVYHVAMRPRY